MKNENDLVNYFIKKTRTYATCTKLENLKHYGTADLLVSCFGQHNFIEFKFKREWPKRKTTLVKFPHFTAKQQRFLIKHGVKGRGCFAAVGVADQLFMLDHIHTDILKVGGTRNQYENLASITMPIQSDWHQMIWLLGGASQPIES